MIALLLWTTHGSLRRLQLRSSINPDYVASNPVCVIRRQRRDHAADVLGLCKPFERLHTGGSLAALIGPDRILVGLRDETGRNRIDPDTAIGERECEVFDQCVD